MDRASPQEVHREERDRALHQYLKQVQQSRAVKEDTSLRETPTVQQPSFNEVSQASTCQEVSPHTAGNVGPREPQTRLLSKHLDQYARLLGEQPRSHTDRQKFLERFLQRQQEQEKNQEELDQLNQSKMGLGSEDVIEKKIPVSTEKFHEADGHNIKRKLKNQRRKDKQQPLLYTNQIMGAPSTPTNRPNGSETGTPKEISPIPAPAPVNYWKHRQEFVQDLAPSSADEEKAMLEKALQLSIKEKGSEDFPGLAMEDSRLQEFIAASSQPSAETRMMSRGLPGLPPFVDKDNQGCRGTSDHGATNREHCIDDLPLPLEQQLPTPVAAHVAAHVFPGLQEQQLPTPPVAGHVFPGLQGAPKMTSSSEDFRNAGQLLAIDHVPTPAPNRSSAQEANKRPVPNVLVDMVPTKDTGTSASRGDGWTGGARPKYSATRRLRAEKPGESQQGEDWEEELIPDELLLVEGRNAVNQRMTVAQGGVGQDGRQVDAEVEAEVTDKPELNTNLSGPDGAVWKSSVFGAQRKEQTEGEESLWSLHKPAESFLGTDYPGPQEHCSSANSGQASPDSARTEAPWGLENTGEEQLLPKDPNISFGFGLEEIHAHLKTKKNPAGDKQYSSLSSLSSDSLSISKDSCQISSEVPEPPEVVCDCQLTGENGHDHFGVELSGSQREVSREAPCGNNSSRPVSSAGFVERAQGEFADETQAARADVEREAALGLEVPPAASPYMYSGMPYGMLPYPGMSCPMPTMPALPLMPQYMGFMPMSMPLGMMPLGMGMGMGMGMPMMPVNPMLAAMYQPPSPPGLAGGPQSSNTEQTVPLGSHSPPMPHASLPHSSQQTFHEQPPATETSDQGEAPMHRPVEGGIPLEERNDVQQLRPVQSQHCTQRAAESNVGSLMQIQQPMVADSHVQTSKETEENSRARVVEGQGGRQAANQCHTTRSSSTEEHALVQGPPSKEADKPASMKGTRQDHMQSPAVARVQTDRSRGESASVPGCAMGTSSRDESSSKMAAGDSSTATPATEVLPDGASDTEATVNRPNVTDTSQESSEGPNGPFGISSPSRGQLSHPGDSNETRTRHRIRSRATGQPPGPSSRSQDGRGQPEGQLVDASSKTPTTEADKAGGRLTKPDAAKEVMKVLPPPGFKVSMNRCVQLSTPPRPAIPPPKETQVKDIPVKDDTAISTSPSPQWPCVPAGPVFQDNDDKSDANNNHVMGRSCTVTAAAGPPVEPNGANEVLRKRKNVRFEAENQVMTYSPQHTNDPPRGQQEPVHYRKSYWNAHGSAAGSERYTRTPNHYAVNRDGGAGPRGQPPVHWSASKPPGAGGRAVFQEPSSAYHQGKGTPQGDMTKPTCRYGSRCNFSYCPFKHPNRETITTPNFESGSVRRGQFRRGSQPSRLPSSRQQHRLDA